MTTTQESLFIDRAWLIEHGADPDCASLAKVTDEWPNGVTLSRDVLVRAAELDADLGWLANGLLGGDRLMAYHAAITPAWEAYIAIKREARTLLWHQRRDAYRTATWAAWSAYALAIAHCLADALGLD